MIPSPGPITNRMPINVSSPGYFDSWFDIASQVKNISSSIAMARYADTEYFIMHGNKFESIDYYKYKGGNTTLHKQMLQSITGQYGKNYYYGNFPEYPPGYFEFVPKMEADIKHFTFANLWINANYAKTKELIKSLIYDEFGEIILLVNDQATNTVFSKEVRKFPTDLNAIWEEKNEIILEDLESLAKKYNNKLFIVSVGPFANVMIWRMFNANPNNRYIDFGSSVVHFTGVQINRPYFDSRSKYRWQIDPSFYINETGSVFLAPINKSIVSIMKKNRM